MAHCLIITGGSIDLDAAFAYLKDIKYDYLIAADHGMDACRALKLIPSLIMGDFDSASNVEYFRKIEGIKWEKFPSHKNETDTELALRKAVELGNDFRSIWNENGPYPCKYLSIRPSKRCKMRISRWT